MSRTLNITCEDCKERLWVGQGACCFYSGEPKTMKALGEFLFKHERHHLSFMDEHSNEEWYSNDNWKDVTDYNN